VKPERPLDGRRDHGKAFCDGSELIQRRSAAKQPATLAAVGPLLPRSFLAQMAATFIGFVLFDGD
jgi:hypothetical protein